MITTQGHGAALAENEELRRQQENQHRDRRLMSSLEGVAFDPIFIIGDHRSGTTLLYQLLASTGAFAPVTAYHVIRYNELLSIHTAGETEEENAKLDGRFRSLGLENRLIDGVGVVSSLPEEYAFVIEDSAKPVLRPANAVRLKELCQKVKVLDGDRNRPVLLKNPWDVLSFRYLKELHPNAKLVFIHRHPLDVMNSQLRAIRSLLGTRNQYLALLAPWYRRLFESPVRLALARRIYRERGHLWQLVTPRHMEKVAAYHFENFAFLPASDLVSIRYEDLCAAPNETMGKVLDFLSVNSGLRDDYQKKIDPRNAPRLPEVESMAAKMNSRLGKWLRYNNYSSK